MKIGIDISQLVFEGTGVSTYSRYLVQNLLKIDKDNHYLLFGSSLRQGQKLETFFQSLKDQKNLSRKFLLLPPVFWEIIWNNLHILPLETFIGKLDIFHTSDWTEPPADCPKITTIHDLTVYKFPQGFPPRIRNNQEKRLQWAKKESRLFITDSQSGKEDLVSILKLPLEKIRVIPLAPRDEFQRDNLVFEAGVVKEKYDLEKPFFLSVGTREPRKNLKTAISAYSRMKHKDNFDFVICGKYGWGEDIKPVPGVKILNWVPDEDLACLYKEAVCFVYPSLYEGFGLPVLEAQNLGCPVISSERGSLSEVLPPKTLRINPDSETTITEALEYIYNIYESPKYFEMVKDGVEFAKNFTWEKTARETLEVYKEAVNNF